MKCEKCKAGEVIITEGKLDQCGDTFLLARITRCPTCLFTIYERIPGETWKPGTEHTFILPTVAIP